MYVTGTMFDIVEYGTDIITLKYDTDGALRWGRQYDGLGQGEDVPVGIICNAPTDSTSEV